MSESLGLIVGSGFSRLGLEVVERRPIETPYGAPSGALLSLRSGEHTLLGLARHGEGHSIAPHEVNYRANVWALHEAGVRHVVAINLVGAIAAGFAPGDFAVPDQLIDYTTGRESSYSGDGRVIHADFTEPFDPVLRGRLADTVTVLGHHVRAGTYGVTQGPRLETAAEIDRLERDGCAMVGMTAMPEAGLARELEMDYAILALAVNYAAGRAPDGAPIHAQINECLTTGMQHCAQILERFLTSS